MNAESAIYGFVKGKIEILDQDGPYSRAMLAKLRRAIGKSPGAVPDIWEITLPDMRDEWRSWKGNPSHAEWAIHTAMTLYALHRQGKNRTMSADNISFGTAAARLASPDKGNLEAVRRRFNAVATSVEFKELAHHARGIVQLLKAADLTMDYPKFAEDLLFFQKDADRVRLRWGEDFYIIPSKNEEKEGE